MSDYLDTKVVECIPGYDHTLFHLTPSGKGEWRKGEIISFEIPLKVMPKEGDRLEFYQGCITGGENSMITHDDYDRVKATRRGKELWAFDARDMRLLSSVKKDY